MNESYATLIAGVVGVVIGSVMPIAGILIQARSQSRRERARLAMQAALEDYRQLGEYVRKQDKSFDVPPLGLYVLHHSRLLDLLEEKKLTAETYKEVLEEQKSFKEIIGHIGPR